MPEITRELAYLLLIIALMVVPRLLQRFRLPAPLTSFGLGMGAAVVIGSSSHNDTLSLLATLGISSLFLFAGLEIEPADFKRGRWPLVRHLVLRSLTVAGTAWLAMHVFSFSWQAAVLLALAVLTPSAGFILDTLPSLDMKEEERYWVRMKAVSGELFALLLLFVVLQSESVERLAWSSSALAAMIIGLPMVLIGLGRSVIPHARGSEFSLLMMVGVISAYLTYKLGVYYLVGAFLAGFIAKLLKRRMPTLASDENLHAIQMFASFFVPFYFFYKGMGVPAGALTLKALALGMALSLLALPMRVGLVWGQRRLIQGESATSSLRVAAALTPTLIFTLVLASILRERFQISDMLYGALLIYAGVSTMLPSLVMRRPLVFHGLPEGARTPEVSEVRDQP